MDEGDPVLDPRLSAFEKAASARTPTCSTRTRRIRSARSIRRRIPTYRFLADLSPAPRAGVDGVCDHRGRRTCWSFRGGHRIIAPPDPVDETAKPVKYGAKVMRRTKHFQYFGFARLQVERGRVDEVLNAINDDTTPGYSGIGAGQRGSSRSSSSWVADTPDEVCERLQALGDGLRGHRAWKARRSRATQYYYRATQASRSASRRSRPSPVVRPGPPPAPTPGRTAVARIPAELRPAARGRGHRLPAVRERLGQRQGGARRPPSRPRAR